MNFKLFLRIFFVFCLIFGIVNIIIGGFALYGYYRIQKTLSVASLELNQSISTAKALLANATVLTSIASSEVGPTSQNITVLITGLEYRISTSKQDFYNESNYFSTFTIPDSSPQQSTEISASFKDIGNQLNATQNQYLPMLLNAVRSTTLKINGSVSGINSSFSKLNQTISLIADNALSEIGTAKSFVSLAMLGFAFYSILEGVVFIMLSVFILYLARNLYGHRKPESDVDEEGDTKINPEIDIVGYHIKPSKKTKRVDKQASISDKEGPERKRSSLLKTIKDTFGIEE